MFKHRARSALLTAVLVAGVVGSPTAAPGGLPVWAARARGGTVLIEAENGREHRSGSGFFLASPGFVATALHTV